MLETTRLFSTLNMQTCRMQWYVQVREGRLGPYDSKYQALIKLKSFVEYCQREGKSGGRSATAIDDEMAQLLRVARRRR